MHGLLLTQTLTALSLLALLHCSFTSHIPLMHMHTQDQIGNADQCHLMSGLQCSIHLHLWWLLLVAGRTES